MSGKAYRSEDQLGNSTITRRHRMIGGLQRRIERDAHAPRTAARQRLLSRLLSHETLAEGRTGTLENRILPKAMGIAQRLGVMEQTKRPPIR